ncbi:hypothetical protein OIU79_024866 [Salix purpurea]|uniref:Uncharacterized protein n=3 Tax=Salix TaxID=40685 RepID=A0A9Q0W3C2_SALPP|nr:hypothetical protein OIU79_024866 [Salix purpurea]
MQIRDSRDLDMSSLQQLKQRRRL